MKPIPRFFLGGVLLLACGVPRPVHAQQATAATVTIDTSSAGRQQTIDGFGTCLSGVEGQQSWWQSLYFDDLRCTLLRVDLTPQFVSPYADFSYNSPWFHNHPALPGPDNNNVRTYTGATDYTRAWTFTASGQNVSQQAAIAVMGPDIDKNAAYFNFDADGLKTAGQVAQLGQAKRAQLSDFKLFGSLWSPAPWVKVSSGNAISGQSGVLAGERRTLAVHLGGQLRRGPVGYVRPAVGRLRRQQPGRHGTDERAHAIRPLHGGLPARFPEPLRSEVLRHQRAERTQLRGVLQQLHLPAFVAVRRRAQTPAGRVEQLSRSGWHPARRPRGPCSGATLTRSGSTAGAARPSTRTCNTSRTSPPTRRPRRRWISPPSTATRRTG